MIDTVPTARREKGSDVSQRQSGKPWRRNDKRGSGKSPTPVLKLVTVEFYFINFSSVLFINRLQHTVSLTSVKG